MSADPKQPKLSTCRSCRRSIIWTRTERGKKMPLDAESVADVTARGLFVLREKTNPEGPLALAAWGLDCFTDPHYRSHFATCPQADQHRSTNRVTRSMNHGSSTASPDADQRGGGRIGTGPVSVGAGSAGEGSRDGGVKPRSQITDLQPPQDPGWRHAGRKYRSSAR